MIEFRTTPYGETVWNNESHIGWLNFDSINDTYVLGLRATSERIRLLINEEKAAKEKVKGIFAKLLEHRN